MPAPGVVEPLSAHIDPEHETPFAEDVRRCLQGAEAFGPTTGDLCRNPADLCDRDVVRLGRHLGLELHQAVVLVLKRQWERFRAERGGGGDAPDTPGASGSPWHREFHAGACGTADALQLFGLFEEEGCLATGSGYPAEDFQTLVQHSILLNLHRLSILGPEVRAFGDSQRVQQALLSEATAGERDAFWDRHRLWRELEEEVGSLLLEVERQALENRRAERRWLEMFGSAYLPLLEAEARCRALERAVGRKAGNPDLTREQLDSLEAADREREGQEMTRLRRALARARVALPSGPGGMPLDDLESLDYEAECRRLRREIYRRTHPDVVGQQGFTGMQRERLTGYYRDAVACADGDGIEDEEIALGMRSLASLEAILARVRKIWEVKGLDVNEGAVIRGNTLAERLGWLDVRIAELEEQAKGVRAELHALATDADVAEKRACLRSPAQAARITQEMEKKRQWYDDQVPALEARLRELFESGGAGGPTVP